MPTHDFKSVSAEEYITASFRPRELGQKCMNDLWGGLERGDWKVKAQCMTEVMMSTLPERTLSWQLYTDIEELTNDKSIQGMCTAKQN